MGSEMSLPQLIRHSGLRFAVDQRYRIASSGNRRLIMRPTLVLSALLGLVLATSVSKGDVNKNGARVLIAQTFCPEVELPVCATKNGERKVYGNECKAKRDGATVVQSGKCEPAK
jgi:hypothetical protein